MIVKLFFFFFGCMCLTLQFLKCPSTYSSFLLVAEIKIIVTSRDCFVSPFQTVIMKQINTVETLMGLCLPLWDVCVCAWREWSETDNN